MIRLDVEVEVEGDGWTALGDLEALCDRAAEAALAVLPDAPSDTSAAILFADDAYVRDINRQWRDQDKPTNVLSFPAAPPPGRPVPGQSRELGDIVLAAETVTREAAEAGRSVADHTAHLVVHGLLHLLGYDHEDPAEADRMEALEVAALARLGISDPYLETA